MSKELVCTNCGCPEPKKTYDGYWCKYCHNEMELKKYGAMKTTVKQRNVKDLQPVEIKDKDGKVLYKLPITRVIDNRPKPDEIIVDGIKYKRVEE